jgi:hypothetical protein
MAAEVHRYKVGDIEVTVLSDGFRMVPVNGNYLINASAEDLAKALAAAGQPTDKMKNTYSLIVQPTAGKRAVRHGNVRGGQRNERGIERPSRRRARPQRDRRRGDLATSST